MKQLLKGQIRVMGNLATFANKRALYSGVLAIFVMSSFASSLVGASSIIDFDATSGPITGGTEVDFQAMIDSPIAQIEGGYNFSVALTKQGTVYAWGWNNIGQLGNGTITNSNVPIAVDISGFMAGKRITQISSGDGQTVALSDDGAIYAWGNGGSGQLGNGASFNRSLPVAVDMSGVLAGKTVTGVSAGGDHSVAVTQDGQVYAWGLNDKGQLGNGTNTNSNVPVPIDMSGVLSGKTVTQVLAGYKHTLALTSDGEVYAWGLNNQGQLGDGSNADSNVPVAIDDSGVLAGKVITQVAAGGAHHSMALAEDGTAYGWGDNNNGELGDGTTTDRNVPVAINTSGVLSGKNITQLATGFQQTMALTDDGSVYAWGANGSGQLGNGTYAASRVPVAVYMSGVLSGKSVQQIAIAEFSSLAVADGAAYSWGVNTYGQLGNSTNVDSNLPVAVNISGIPPIGAPTVTFGGAAATDVTLTSPTTFRATAPANMAGPADIVVSFEGEAPITLTAAFTYIDPNADTGGDDGDSDPLNPVQTSQTKDEGVSLDRLADTGYNAIFVVGAAIVMLLAGVSLMARHYIKIWH